MLRTFQTLVRTLCGTVIAGALWTADAPRAAAEDAYGRLYEQAREARLAGDFGAAAADLERALVLRPDSVEALYLLGMVEAFRKRYSEGLARLRRARAFDSGNDDVALGIARVLSWSGDQDAAEREVSALLARRPDNAEARLFKARLVYYQGRHGEAEALLRAFLAREPGNPEALELMGDVRVAAGDTASARDFYGRVLEIAPDSPGVARKLDQSRSRPWRFDAGYAYSWFSREDRDEWHEGFVQLRYALTPDTGLLGRVEAGRRFRHEDVLLAVGADHKLDEWLSGHLLFGGTPDADFRERWLLSGGISARLWRGRDELGATLLTLDARRSNYDDGNVDTLSPGLQQYLFAGRVWLTGQWINTFDQARERIGGVLGRVDWQAGDRLRLYLGGADAGETVAGETVDTRSYFAGVVIALPSGRGLRLDYLHEDREGSYIRRSLGLGFSQRF